MLFMLTLWLVNNLPTIPLLLTGAPTNHLTEAFGASFFSYKRFS